jgi:hypothetical protein
LSISAYLVVSLRPGVSSGARPDAFFVGWDAFDLVFELVEETGPVGGGLLEKEVLVLAVHSGFNRARSMYRYLL